MLTGWAHTPPSAIIRSPAFIATPRPTAAKSFGRTEAHEEVKEAVLDSVRHHLVADVPVGAFLSGGIDLSVLVSLMRHAGQREIQTVTLAFEEFHGRPENEAPLAAEIARLYDTHHTTRIVTKSEFTADLPRILEAMDQPSIDGINTWFVSKAAHEIGLKVAVSGLGGDELFGGYPSFRDIPRWVRVFSIPGKMPLLGTLLRLLGQGLLEPWGSSPKAAGMAELGGTYAGAYLLRRGLFMPWELMDVFDRDMIDQGLRRLEVWQLINEALTPQPGTAFARVAALELSLYMRNQLLRDTDWSSMAHGLEVRVPLVDSKLLPRLASITSLPFVKHKALLASAADPVLPNLVRKRPKSGFMTPVATWQNGSAALSTRRYGVHWARDWARNIAGRNDLMVKCLACAS